MSSFSTAKNKWSVECEIRNWSQPATDSLLSRVFSLQSEDGLYVCGSPTRRCFGQTQSWPCTLNTSHARGARRISHATPTLYLVHVIYLSCDIHIRALRRELEAYVPKRKHVTLYHRSNLLGVLEKSDAGRECSQGELKYTVDV